jgi:tRNA threonylcarbamoyladenosine biosynthesis protein TsaE
MTILDELRAGVVTESAEETRRCGEHLAVALPPDTTLALHGDLGVGKTTFVQGLARGFGLSSQVTSPTFNILHIYRGIPPPPRANTSTLVHLDAYRLENAHQIAALMLEDFLVTPYCLAVEWPERIAGWLPPAAWHLTLAIESPGRHRLTLQSRADGCSGFPPSSTR